LKYMILTINIILIAISITILAPMAAFALECFLAIWPRRSKRALATGRHPHTVVLIPAHNEELVIEQTLGVLIPTLSAGDRVLVVADNCDDRTADVARTAGAEVAIRLDPERRGKGYALDFAVHYLRQIPPEVVVILDADCLVSADTINILAQQALQSGRQVQALNLTDCHSPTASRQILAMLANRFTNLIRPLGLLRAGLPCRLMGTGLAMPWPLLESVPFVGDNLVEDMQWGIDLALAGYWPLFCPEARVTSALPLQDRAFVSQRRRWEHGHLRTIIAQVPLLMARSLLRRDIRLFCLAWDLSIPPLALLAILWSAAIILSLAATLSGVSWWPAAILAVGGIITALAFSGAWFVHCRRQIPLKALLTAPLYILCKLPIYFSFITSPQSSWVRTARDKTPCGDSTR
jgi:cellulose synthase/poly-beta-1,6-N-acetylglucosamine synthase-like glycosyltransferase